MNVFLSYKESVSGGEVCPGEEGDKWASHEPEYVEWNPVELTKLKPDSSYNVETLEVPKLLETYWLVVVRYQTDGTFGYTSGAWSLQGLYTVEEATRVKDYIEFENTKPKPSELKKKFPGIDIGYKPWQGYFKELEEVEIHRMQLS